MTTRQFKCINALMAPQLQDGDVYMVDLREQERNPVGEAYYFIDGKRYGSWRFEPVEGESL